MGEKEVNNCIAASGKENLVPARIKEIMVWADADNFVTREAFINFYEGTIKNEDIDIARLNLFTKFGYTTDLRVSPKAGDPNDIMQLRNVTDMPRYKIANNQKYFDTIYSLPNMLTKSDALKSANVVCSMLCTKMSIIHDVFWLNDRPQGKGPFKWDMIFSDDIHATMYTLEIINSILKNDSTMADDPSYEEVFLNKEDWIERFLKQGGID